MAYRQGLDTGAVLQAAVEIADEQGIEQVTLAALAAKLHVKTPSLYNHIQGLPGLRKQLALLGYERLKETLIRAVIGKSGEAAVKAAGLAYVSFAREQKGLYEATAIVPEQQDEELKQRSGEVVELMLRILDGYGFDTEEALHVVRGFRSLVHGFASLEKQGGFRMALDRDKSLEHLLSTYLRGLRTPEQS